MSDDPYDILEYEPGLFSWTFSDFEPHSEYLQQQGGHGGGYSWEAMVKAALELRSLHLPDVEFDPESDMFEAHSPDKASLEAIARVSGDLTSDRKFMADAISHAKKRGYFE